jgi:hypothetical protein
VAAAIVRAIGQQAAHAGRISPRVIFCSRIPDDSADLQRRKTATIRLMEGDLSEIEAGSVDLQIKSNWDFRFKRFVRDFRYRPAYVYA